MSSEGEHFLVNTDSHCISDSNVIKVVVAEFFIPGKWLPVFL